MTRIARTVAAGWALVSAAWMHQALGAVGATAGVPSVSATGAAQYTVPLWLPNGTAGLAPSLALSYNHRAGNGTTGTGWSVSGFSVISRCNRNLAQDLAAGPIRMGSDDRFCLDGQRLRLANGNYGEAGSEYRTEFDVVARIRAYGVAGDGPAYFVVDTKDGERRTYGGTSDSAIEVFGSSAATAKAWALSRHEDRFGNAMVYSYVEDSNGGHRPSQIAYTVNGASTTGQYVVQFNYVDRPDIITGFEAGPAGISNGGQVLETKLLDSIAVLAGGSPLRQYRFTYEAGAGGRRRMASFQECGANTSDCLGPTVLQWQNGSPGVGGESTSGAVVPVAPHVMDVNGDGYDDLVYANGTWRIQFGSTSGFGTLWDTGIPSGTAENAAKALPLEWNGDGKEDLLIADADGYWKVLVSNGSSFISAAPVANPNFSHTGNYWFTVADFNGDGRDDLLRASNISNPSYRYGELFVALRESAGFGPLVIRWQGFGDTEIRFYSTSTDKPFGPSGHLSSNARKRVDLNGDGREDVVAKVCYTISLTSCPGGWDWYGFLGTDGDLTQPLVLTPLNTTNNSTRIWFGRFNFDSYTDTVYIADDGAAYISLSRGYGVQYVGGISLTSYDTARMVVFDYDADGYDDLVLPNSSNVWCVLRSNGQGLEAPMCNGPSIAAARSVVADVNGDGLADLAYADSSTNGWRFRPKLGVRPDLLLSATDGFGNAAGFGYLPISSSVVHAPGTGAQYPIVDFVGTEPLVRTLTMTPAGRSAYSMSFAYAGNRLDQRGRSLGFARRTVTDHRNGVYAVSSYSQLLPYIGLQLSETLYQPSGTTIASVANTFGQHVLEATAGNERYLRYLQSSVHNRYEVGAPEVNGSHVATTTMTFTVDSFGTITDQTSTTAEISTGLNPSATHTQRTWHSSVLNDVANWCLGRPTQTSQINSHTLPGGASLTRTIAHQWDAAKCNVTEQTVQPGAADLQVTTNFGFDSFGNIETIIEAPYAGHDARTTQINWGSTGQFTQSVTDPEGQVTSFTWNAGGTLATQTAPNGLVTTTWYDAFNRPTRAQHTDGTATDYVLHASSAGDLRWSMDLIERSATNAAVRTDQRYFDGSNRLRYAYTQMLDGSYSQQHTTYDDFGRVQTQSVPYLLPGTDYQTVITYDILGRPTLMRRPNSATDSSDHDTTITYLGLQTTVTDAMNRTTRTVRNALDEIVQVIDPANSDTEYYYDAFRNLLRTRDVLGNEIVLTYDALGRKLTSSDPDLGAWQYTYYPFGELKTQTNANHELTSFTYDRLSRPLTRIDHAEAATTSWLWGTSTDPNDLNKGQLVSVTAPGFTESYLYDERGRPKRRRIVSDATYDYHYTYSASTGLLDTLAYPTSTLNERLTLQYVYQYGQLQKVQDANASTVFWQATATNPRGQVIQEQLGNGVVRNRAIDSVTGLVSHLQAGIGGGAGLQNESYLYDAMGNLAQRQNGNAGLTENFYYDALDRLDYSTRGGTPNLDLSYDVLGNLTARSDLANGAAWVYHSTKKHAVVQAGPHTYGYDANGNVTLRDGQEIQWTSYNAPVEIHAPGKTLRFDYGPDRQRYRQVYENGSSTETTQYIGGALEKVTAGGITDWRHHVEANGTLVAIVSRKSNGTNTTRYLLEDHQGSIAQILNANGSLYVSESFEAFGARRDAGDWDGECNCTDLTKMKDATRRGYTGHEMIGGVSLGLIHMNGRVQDSITGRFLSPDPLVQAPFNAQSFNRYSYVFNNPLTYTDPSGFQTSADGPNSPGWWLFYDLGNPRDAYSDWTIPLQSQFNWFAEQLAAPWVPVEAVDSTVGGTLLAQLDVSATAAANSNLARLVLAFDGAGGEYTGDNRAFRNFARRYSAVLYDENAFSGHSNGRPAIARGLSFSKENPGGPIFILGYSAGGDEAIYVANQLAGKGVKISGLVTFDPHIDSFIGIRSYSLNSNVVRALNFQQVNPVELGPNTFRGGYVDGALNVILSDSNHITIVSDALRLNRALIEAMLIN